MPDSRTLWTTVVIICIAVSVFFSVKKRTTFKRLQQLMAAKQWDDFDRLLDAKLTSMLYPRYNRDYLRLNSYLLREDHKRADEMFDLLLGLNLPKMQRVDLVIKAFNYYVGQEDRKKSKKRGRYADDDETSEDDVMAERIIRLAPPITAITCALIVALSLVYHFVLA